MRARHLLLALAASFTGGCGPIDIGIITTTGGDDGSTGDGDSTGLGHSETGFASGPTTFASSGMDSTGLGSDDDSGTTDGAASTSGSSGEPPSVCAVSYDPVAMAFACLCDGEPSDPDACLCSVPAPGVCLCGANEYPIELCEPPPVIDTCVVELFGGATQCVCDGAPADPSECGCEVNPSQTCTCDGEVWPPEVCEPLCVPGLPCWCDDLVPPQPCPV